MQNTYKGIKVPGAKPALSARIYGDKSAFYDCAFLRVQDILWDASGRAITSPIATLKVE